MVKLKYLLDTNICIYLLKGLPVNVAHEFSKYKMGELAISSLTWAELCCGLDLHNSKQDLDSFLRQVSPQSFDLKAASVFGQLSQQYPQRKSTLDRMIAAHAIALNVVLVTNNTSDFEIYKSAGLEIENWIY